MNNDHIINCPCCDHQMMVDYQSESLMSFFCANVECDINKHTAYRFPFTYSIQNSECIDYLLPFKRNNEVLYLEGSLYNDLTKIYCYNHLYKENMALGLEQYNSCIGHQAMFSNTTGSSNVAIGYKAGFAGTEKILISVPFIPIKIENQNTNAKDIFERLLKLKAFV